MPPSPSPLSAPLSLLHSLFSLVPFSSVFCLPSSLFPLPSSLFSILYSPCSLLSFLFSPNELHLYASLATLENRMSLHDMCLPFPLSLSLSRSLENSIKVSTATLEGRTSIHEVCLSFFSSEAHETMLTKTLPGTARRLTCPAVGLLPHTLGRACAAASLCKAPRHHDAGSPKRPPLSALPRSPPPFPPTAQKAK